jgi:hypothetical protein
MRVKMHTIHLQTHIQHIDTYRSGEIWPQIEQEWAHRKKISKQAAKKIKSAEALIYAAADAPAVRDDLRKFIINPKFQEARNLFRDLKETFLAPALEYTLHQGTISRGGITAVELDNKKPSKNADGEKGANSSFLAPIFGRFGAGATDGQDQDGHHQEKTGPASGGGDEAELPPQVTEGEENKKRTENDQTDENNRPVLHGNDQENPRGGSPRTQNEEPQSAVKKPQKDRVGNLTSLQQDDDMYTDTNSHAYVGRTLRILEGSAKGCFSTIKKYDQDTKTAYLWQWYPAVPDVSSRLEILSSGMCVNVCVCVCLCVCVCVFMCVCVCT